MTDRTLGGGESSAKPPVLLTKLDALTWAADQLERFMHNMELTKVILDAVEKSVAPDAPRNDPETKARFDALKRDCPEPALQVVAARAGVKAIRDIVLEERLVSARVGAGAGIGA